MAKQVTVIPPTINLHTKQPSSNVTKRKVAAYARVSTDSDEQFTSYEAQIDYYTQYIKRNPNWEFVDVFLFKEYLGAVFFKLTNGNKAVDSITGKATHTLGHNKVNLTAEGIVNHSVEAITLFCTRTGYALISINIYKLPIRITLYVLSVIIDLCLIACKLLIAVR